MFESSCIFISLISLIGLTIVSSVLSQNSPSLGRGSEVSAADDLSASGVH